MGTDGPDPADQARVRVLSSSVRVRGSIFDVVEDSIELPSGRRQELFVVQHPGAVCVAPIDDDGRLVLVRQYRHAVRDWLIEIPAGRLEPGEDPLDAAKRELEEETDLRAEHWSPARQFLPAPGFCSEVLHLFFARDLKTVPGGGLPPDPDEEFELLRLSPTEVLSRAEVRDGKTLLAAALLSATDA